MSFDIPPVSDLLPHKDKMVLLDGIVSYSPEDKMIVARVDVTEESPFYDDRLGGVPNFVSIEYMAQASVALAEISQKANDPSAKPRPGMLLGTRKLGLDTGKFEKGRRYLVSAKDVFDDGTTASFECEVRDAEGNTVAAASLTAYRPEDFTQFLKERTS